MNDLWGVPRSRRPNFLKSRLRGLGLLFVLGGGVLITTVVAGVGTAAGGHPLWKVVGLVLATTLNVGLFLLSFRVLTVEDVSWADLVPGSILAGVLWEILQLVGGYYISHQLRGASQVYGF